MQQHAKSYKEEGGDIKAGDQLLWQIVKRDRDTTRQTDGVWETEWR